MVLLEFISEVILNAAAKLSGFKTSDQKKKFEYSVQVVEDGAKQEGVVV